MPQPRSTAWFRARQTLGYGWGLPLRWQGWVVMIGWFVGLFTGTFLLSDFPVGIIGFVLGWSGLLVLICWWKGEPARWSW